MQTNNTNSNYWYMGNLTNIAGEIRNMQLLILDLSVKREWTIDELKTIPHHFLATTERLWGLANSNLLHLKTDENNNIIAVSLLRFD